jgi:hypothetical protein
LRERSAAGSTEGWIPCRIHGKKVIVTDAGNDAGVCAVVFPECSPCLVGWLW